jgi:hypothetical protein
MPSGGKSSHCLRQDELIKIMIMADIDVHSKLYSTVTLAWDTEKMTV